MYNINEYILCMFVTLPSGCTPSCLLVIGMPGGGGDSHRVYDRVYAYVPAFWGAIS